MQPICRNTKASLSGICVATVTDASLRNKILKLNSGICIKLTRKHNLILRNKHTSYHSMASSLHTNCITEAYKATGICTDSLRNKHQSLPEMDEQWLTRNRLQVHCSGHAWAH
ncbi:hypothetical protein AVEN_21959-1 [Araneus ventricosus]|uniref:Uncharacterized protein n=1 Tax=Araneus ventricosus TaxID=182803 RepID=A0A4Y2NMG7_ARAVE|nr:hypothetical protein AVEN_21959-1 [Araneus ventricosus]